MLGLTVISAINPLNDAVLSADAGLLIKGQVRLQGVRTPCRVRLYEKLSGRLIADIATDAQGNYEFKNLTELPFFIVAHHPASQFNAVIQDNVVPK